jgi:beta-lactamase regulating signal transducer with metallopeptidase domain
MLIDFIKINILLTSFTLIYHLALRKLTFYQLNRWYLLLAIGCSVIYPFIDLSSFFSAEQQTTLSQFVPAVSYELPQDSGNIFSRISVLFLAGVLVMAFRLCRQFISLYDLHKKSVSGRLHDTTVRLMNNKVNPFSFGKHIYINPHLHNIHEQKTILTHEKIHVQQWHTLDIMLTESILVCCWFNPAAWFMRKAIRENLEFIADEAVLEKGTDRKMYQYSLLEVSTGLSALSIANEFTLQDIKKRIQMMNGQRSSRFRLVSYSAFPLLLSVFLLFTVSAKETRELLQSLTTIEDTLSPSNMVTDKSTAKINGTKETQPATARKRVLKKTTRFTSRNIAAQLLKTNNTREENNSSETLMEETVLIPLQPENTINSTEQNDIKIVKGFSIPTDSDAAINNSPVKKVTGVPIASPEQTSKEEEHIIVTGYPRPKQQ